MPSILTVLSILLTPAHAADVNNDGCEDAYEGTALCVSVDSTLGAGTTVGAGSEVRPYAAVGSEVAIGASVVIAERATLGGRDGAAAPISIGDGTVIGRRTNIGNDFAIGSDVTIARAVSAGTDADIGDDAVLGYGVTLGDGVTVGNGATLGSLVDLGDHTDVAPSAILARSVVVADAPSAAERSQIGGIVGPGAQIGTSVVVEPGARLRKDVTLASGAQIRSTARIGRDAQVGAGTQVFGTVRAGGILGAGAIIEDGAVVSRGATVCDYATLADGDVAQAGRTWPPTGCLPPASCAEIQASGGASGSHAYTIDPDGDGPMAPLDAYCDMETEGGGWTLVWKQTGFASTGVAHNDARVGDALLLDEEFDGTTQGSIIDLFPEYTEVMFKSSETLYARLGVRLDDPFWTTHNGGRCGNISTLPDISCAGVDCSDYRHLYIEMGHLSQASGFILGRYRSSYPNANCGEPWCSSARHGRYNGGCQNGSAGEGDWMMYIR